jgi:signal transduction histidine kinase/ligand-binding sensor domain-containing protein
MNAVLRRPNEFARSIALPRIRATVRIAAIATLLALAHAQTLALRHYDVTDGLASSRIVCMHQDAKGYLWLGAWEGLCRFDGHEIVTFGSADGIESPVINSIAEDALGDLWAATNGGGIVRFLDASTPARAGERSRAFESYRIAEGSAANVVDALLFDRRGDLWCGTEAGLYRATGPLASPPKFERVADARPDWPQALVEDHGGRVWLGTTRELLEWRDGRFVAHAVPSEMQLGECIGIFERGDGSFSCAFQRGLSTFTPCPSGATQDRWSAEALSLASDQTIRAMLPMSNGVTWIATTKGLLKRTPESQTTYTVANGLSDDLIFSLLQDRDHNLWIGTWSGGACKLVSESIVSFTIADGLPSRNALRLVPTGAGPMVVTTGLGAVVIDGDRTTLLEGSLEAPFDKIAQRIVEDRRGDFWLGTDVGVYRCQGPRLELDRAERLGRSIGLPEALVFSLVEESRGGRIRIAFDDGPAFRIDPDRADDLRFERPEYELPPASGPPRESFLTAGGSLWIAPYNGLWRFANGRTTEIAPLVEGTTNQVRCFHQSADGKLWIGTRFQGVFVTEDPEAPEPRFRNYSTREGLASDAVWSITEDERHRIYLGTARGLERLDPASGRVHHFATFEGLAGDIVYHCTRDAKGFIWAATSNGVSRIDPRAEELEPAPPPVYIARVQVAGRELALPLSGAQDIAEETFPAADDNMRVDYRAISLRNERELRYQYRLEGVDHDWSEPTTQRSVNYAEIPPGDYRFLVRALHAEGAASPRPATFAFHILPPFWRTWWFVALSVLAAASTVLALHRARVRRVLALESIRRQIATDIHDDMGAGLSQIAILSEVAKREASSGARSHLDEVARLARGLRDSMSDIVWAVDPRRDHASDLVQRMRQVAFNLFEAEGVKVELHAPPNASIETVVLAPDRRRHLLLVFKEALSNVARHARASEVRIDVRLSPSELDLSIRDDGVGFDPAAEARRESRGHGLASLRLRAEALRARLSIRSEVGQGTSIELSMPL